MPKWCPPQPKDLTAASLAYLKDFVEGKVFVAETHQWVRRKNLLHGSVLALRAYLIGDMETLVVASGGRGKRRQTTQSELQTRG